MKPKEAIEKLEAAKAEIANTTPANPEQAAAKQALLEQIDERIAVCQEDINIRAENAANKEALAAVEKEIQQSDKEFASLVEFHKQIFDKYPERPSTIGGLSPEDQNAYLQFRQKDKELRAKRDPLEKRKIELKKQREEIRKANRELRERVSVGGKLPATPTDGVCVPCAKEQAEEFSNKQHRQKGGKAIYPGPQKYGNCGIQSSNQIIAAATGTLLDEKSLMEQAIGDGNARDVFLGGIRRSWFGEQNSATGGTTATGRQQILLKNGVPSDIYETTPDGLAESIQENKGIIVSVDAGVLWNDAQYLGGGHAIVVYDGDFDENGDLTHVYINDTGADKQGRKMEINEFMAAANARKPESSMNVTDDPVF